MDFSNYTFFRTDEKMNTQIDFRSSIIQTLLIGIPCGFLWIFSTLELYFIKKKRLKIFKWSFIYLSKTLLYSILILNLCIDIYFMIINFSDPVLVIMWIIKIATIILAYFLLYLNRRFAILSSGILFIFWISLLVLSIPYLILEILDLIENKIVIFFDLFKFYSTTIKFILTLSIVILNCFADHYYCDDNDEDSEEIIYPSPENRASFLNRIFYVWYDQLTWKGLMKPLEVDDVYELDHENRGKSVIPEFYKYLYKKTEEGVNQITGNRLSRVSILPAIIKAFGSDFYLAGLIRLVITINTFVAPQFLRLLLVFFSIGGPLWEGFSYAFALFAFSLLTALLNAQHFHRTYSVGFKVRTALVSAIYRKSLKLSPTEKKNTTVGEIVNLMAIDAQRFYDTLVNIHILWAGPVVISVAIYFLWGLLGISAMAGVALMVLLIPTNILIAKSLKKIQQKHMTIKDERIKLMNEVLSGIKIIKLNAWELCFEKQIVNIREKELKLLKSKAYLQTLKYFLWSIAPFLVGFVSIMTFVLLDKKNVLTPEIVFVSMAYFNILRIPMSIFPIVISNLLQIFISTKRINNFLNANELNPENITKDKNENAITISNGNFKWNDTGEHILKDIDVIIPKKNLIAIIGPVGSGKSSFISALLGEMNKSTGTVNIDGTIAYVAQQAWIQNGTLKDNILFGRPYNPFYYQKVIEACALSYDLEILPGGDQTEIGEKGINLSGGQKQRVSLARAVYSDADIFLFDDPLSAVDYHVGQHIFDNIIGPNGILTEKTRVLVTHAINFLPQFNNIIVLSNGSITAQGKYIEFVNPSNESSNTFIKFLNTLSKESEDKKDDFPTQIDITDDVKSETSSIDEISSVHGIAVPEQFKLVKEEDVGTGNVQAKIYFQYFKNIGIFVSLIIIVMMISSQGIAMYSSIWLVKWVNDKNSKVPEVEDRYVAIYGTLGVVQSFTLYIATFLLAMGSLRASRNLHFKLLHNCLRLPLKFFDTTPIGRVLNRFSRDIDVVDDDIPLAIKLMVITLFMVISIFIIIIYSTPQFFIVAVPIGMLYYFIYLLHINTSRQIIRLESVTRSPIYSHFSESITGQSTIRAFQEQKRFIRESERRMDFNQKFSYMNIIANRWIGIRLESVTSFVVLFAAIFGIIERSDISPALIGMSLSYALQIATLFNLLVRISTDIESKIISVERIEEYSNVEQEPEWNKPDDDEFWPKIGKIEFHNFDLRYRRELEPVLKNINFSIQDCEKIGIAGRTGSGKSSLLLGIFRIIEADNGQILIDNKNIANIGLHLLRSKLSIIPQDPFIFSGTFRMNVDPFSMYSDHEIWHALELSNLKSFVANLENGLSYELSEGGENLSVGQRQLICLARALLRKSKILVLDEATASIDYENDSLIQKTIRTEFKNCTVITIAHRLNSIMDSDRIMVLDNGIIIEFDTPAALLANTKSAFYKMAKGSNLI